MLNNYSIVTQHTKDGKTYTFYRSDVNPRDEKLVIDDGDPQDVVIREYLTRM